MDHFLAVFLLGLIEGITEFLPISSTAHLLLAEHFGLGARSELFNIAIQSGAIIAVTVIYRQRLAYLLANWRQPTERDYLLKILAAFGITAVLGLLVKKLGWTLDDKIVPIATALMTGGVVILLIERFFTASQTDQPMTWLGAVSVGMAQVLAGVFPGTSRSAASIFAGMGLGQVTRSQAAEFAFLVGIPTMLAATGYSLMKTLSQRAPTGVATENWSLLGFGVLISAMTAFVAVAWLLKFIQKHKFTWFGYYRIGLGLILLAIDSYQRSLG
jgi:undecaprenyl-diphosphatase